ncbi:MAG: PEP/pyruvate-binding domain-containing protein [Pseudonocardiaceae bacterium]
MVEAVDVRAEPFRSSQQLRPVTASGAETDTPLVVALDGYQATDTLLVGAKAANLARLQQGGFTIPYGFCVTTAAYTILRQDSRVADLIERLMLTDSGDEDTLSALAGQLRDYIGQRSLPPVVCRAVAAALEATGTHRGYAVRSSATAEDLPYASFAGQHETVLNVREEQRLFEAIQTCMASLFTERAIRYRAQHRIPEDRVAMAVLVQQMIEPEVAGVAFSADPKSGNRHVAVIEAVLGLGEAQVSGKVTPDRVCVDRLRDRILDYAIGDQRMIVESLPEGGIRAEELQQSHRPARLLANDQALALTKILGDVEGVLGGPQDVEWALAGGRFAILQSRPITTLFPLPSPPPADEHIHVYYSFGHKQAMPEAMPPLVLDIWQRLAATPFGTAVAGGRLYIDVTALLARPVVRKWMLRGFGLSDKPAQAELMALLKRHDLASSAHAKLKDVEAAGLRPRNLARVLHALLVGSTSGVAGRERTWYDNYAAAAIARIRAHPDQLGRVRAVVAQLVTAVQDVVNRFYPFLAATIAETWLKRLCEGEETDIDALGKGLKVDVITAMNLALGDLADIARDHPPVAAAIREGKGIEQITSVEGGGDFRDTLRRFLAEYGFRGPAEIDLSRPRWHEDPTPLLQAIRGNLAGGAKGEQRAHVDRLAQQARLAAGRLREHATEGALGGVKQSLVTRLVEVIRAYLPIREMPKFALAKILAEARSQLLDAGAALVRQGRLAEVDDVWFLRLDELTTGLNDPMTPLGVDIAQRRSAFQRHAAMRAPRIVTSEGEVGAQGLEHGVLPSDTLVGTPVSSGVAEGRARVVFHPNEALLEKNEILVGRYCDPGWTPLFLNAAGMVMEVGGLMTHGSLVAREYGIPAVVSVDGATTRIRTGQRIRVDGNRGTVKLLT